MVISVDFTKSELAAEVTNDVIRLGTLKVGGPCSLLFTPLE